MLIRYPLGFFQRNVANTTALHSTICNREDTMIDLAGALVSPAEYQRLQTLCVHGMELPSTFEGWEALLRVAESDAVELGLPTSPLRVDVDEFQAWSSNVGIRPCLEALRAFMIVKRHTETDKATL